MADITEQHHGATFGPAPLREVSDQHWYAVRTSPRHEKKVEWALRQKSVATFLPLVSTLHQWSDRRRLVCVPLFPGYVFVHACLNRFIRLSLLRTRGVLGFVGNMGIGTPLPDQQIEAIRNVIDSGVYCCPHPFLTTGQRVRIAGGCLDGLEGILLAKNEDHSVVVSVDLIQKALALRVIGYRIIPV